MNSKFGSALIGLILLATMAGTAFFETDKIKLRRPLDRLRANATALDRLATDNREAKSLVAKLENRSEEGATAIHADLVQARAELEHLEAKAKANYRQVSAEAAAAVRTLNENRDPEKALTKLDNLADVGRATPAATIQTLVWAALRGHGDLMEAGITMEESARIRAQALLEKLPEAAREKYRTPERLAALGFAELVLEATALQILDIATVDSNHARVTVRIRAMGREKEAVLPLQRERGGWQMTVSAEQIERLERRVAPE